jgi:hypothetical protein
MLDKEDCPPPSQSLKLRFYCRRAEAQSQFSPERAWMIRSGELFSQGTEGLARSLTFGMIT